METSLADELEGGLGNFWPFAASKPNIRRQPEHGYVHREGGWLTIETIDERSWANRLGEEDAKNPVGIAALLSERSVLFLETIWSGATQRSGYRVSSRRYRARTAIGRIPLDDLQSSKLMGLTANFHGIGSWTGLTATEESHEADEDGRLESWTVTLKSPPSTIHAASRGRKLELSTTWKVDGPEDNRRLSAPVSISCTSGRARDVWDLLQPLLNIQNLLNFAWEGFVRATSGSARLHLKPNASSQESTELWNGALMVPLAGASSPKSMSQHPLFSLSTIGGLAGLARWVKLCDAHPRAVGAVVNLYRFGPTTSETTLLNTAAAIEYWIKTNRPAAWADGHFTKRLARHVGRPFAEWAGDPEAWADDFWKTYNKLKHEITYAVEPRKVSDLARSGRLLLAADLLNRVACTKKPSRWLFNSHRTYNLGERLRDRYT